MSSCLPKVILGLLFPPSILYLEFKSKEELQLMPQTMEEHLDELEDAQSVTDISMSSFSEDPVSHTIYPTHYTHFYPYNIL